MKRLVHGRAGVPPLYLTYLNALDVAALALNDDEILDAIESGLAAQGRKETVIEPRMHLVPDPQVNGHFNVLRGAFKAPLDLAGVKVIGDYVDNYRDGLPSEMGLLLLMDPRNGVPKAIIDGSHLTDMRTGAVTAIGAKHLARRGARVLGHVGARGTAYWNVRLLDHLFDFAPAVEPRRLRRAALPRSRQAGARDRRLALLRRGRRYRRRGLASFRTGADAEDGMDQARGPHCALRHDERGRAVAHRHHGEDRRR